MTLPVLSTALAAALLLSYQLAPLPLAAIAALGFTGLAWRWPVAGLSAVLLALPYHRIARPVTASWDFSAAEVGIVLCVGAAGLGLTHRAIARAAETKRPIELASWPLSKWRRIDAIDLAALAFVALALVSLAVSIKPVESLRVLRTVVLEPVAFYFVATRLAGTRAKARWLLNALVLSAAAIALVGLYQYVANQNIITAEESLRRIRGFYGSPNHLALYLGRAAPIALCLAAFQPRARWSYVLALAVVGAALLLTFSIGAWVAVVAAGLSVAALRGRRTLLLSLSALAVAAAVAAPVLLGLERFRSHLDFGEGTTYLRVQVWLAALAMIRDHPLLGVGLDNFLYYYRDLGYRLPGGWREPELSHPHNLVFDFWLSLGLAGLGLALLLLVRFFRMAHAAYVSERDPWAHAAALGSIGSMVAFVVHGLIDNSYFLPDLAVLFWLGFAIVRVLRATAPPHDPLSK